jgi:hypothetical protein
MSSQSTQSNIKNQPPKVLEPDNSKIELELWLFIRLLVPTGPIIIQYALYGLSLIPTPDFPQITYRILLFGLSLVTVSEYKGLRGILYGSIVPALVATVLYTAALISEKSNPIGYENTLLAGFILWLLLVIINSVRVVTQWIKSR